MEFVGVSAENGAFAPFAGVGRFVSCELPLRHVDLMLEPEEGMMTLRLGELAPDFEAETTEGRLRFHDWIGDGWAVLFSHPKNYTPVCTTELGYMAKI